MRILRIVRMVVGVVNPRTCFLKCLRPIGGKSSSLSSPACHMRECCGVILDMSVASSLHATRVRTVAVMRRLMLYCGCGGSSSGHRG